jgi:hypothetical protein
MRVPSSRTIVPSARSCGPGSNASRDDTLWYYRAVLDVIGRRSSSSLVDELARTINQLEDLALAQIVQR